MIKPIVVLAVLASIILPSSWRIAAKAGYPPALSLLMLVSPINLVLLVLFATREWPIERKLRLQQGPQSNP